MAPRPASIFAAFALALALLAPGALAQSCPKCGRDVSPDYRFCPYDGAAIPEPRCPKCGHALEREWSFCPFDGTARGGAAPAAAPADAAKPAPAPAAAAGAGAQDRLGGNPFDTIEALFRSIAAGDDAGIRRLYDWPRFFPEVRPADLDTEIAGYVKRLIERVKPTLEGSERQLVDVKLGRADARIKVSLRKVGTHAAIAEYDFTLVDAGRGWTIAAIKP
jgi:hypothetical protein